MEMTPTFTPRLPLHLAALVAAAVALALLFPGLSEASPTSKLTPLVTCVDVNTDGTITAHFGYTNIWTNQINVPVGNRPGQVNYFSPDPEDRGQPTKFQPGTFNDVFTVTFSGTLTWFLDDVNSPSPNNVTASAGDTRCAPVPALGLDSPLPLALVAVLGGVILALRRRRELGRARA